jgi:hypothetical protein
VCGDRSSTLFRRQRRLDKVLDEVSTAIHGGGAAVNKLICGFRLSSVFTYLAG